MSPDTARNSAPMGRLTPRTLLLNVGVVLLGMLAMIGIFIGSANLSNDGPRQQVAAAFADGTLSFEIYRMLEPVPGFIVAESDSNSSCVMYALMLSSSSE